MSAVPVRTLDLAERAVELWGGSEQPPRLVKQRENMVFDARLRCGRRVALRLHRPGYQSRAAITSELWWTRALAERGLPVAVPVPSLAGGLVEWMDDRAVSCVGWLDGAPIGSGDAPLTGTAEAQEALMRQLGRLIAAVQRETDGLSLPADFERPAWDAEGLLGEAPRWGRFWESPAFSAPERDLVQRARERARQLLDDCVADGTDFGLIHADFVRENIIAGPRGLALIDFDDSGFGFRLYDLASALTQSLEEPRLPLLVRSLVAGYRELRELPHELEGRLALFLLLRTFASAGWVVGRAGPDDPRHRVFTRRAVLMARHVLAGTAPWD